MLAFTDGALAAAGWVPAVGDAARNLGSALGAMLYRGPDVRATVRLVVGVKLSRLEYRAHGTPTGRCSSGHWVMLAQFPSPAAFNRRGWATLARRVMRALGDARLGSPGLFSGVCDYARGDANRCGTRANASALEPTAAGGSPGRGRIVRENPTREEMFEAVPAAGRMLLTHSPERIAAGVRADARRAASEAYRASVARARNERRTR